MKLKTICINEYEISYIDQGQGRALILVHGSLGDYRSWENQIKPFSNKYRTIVLSLRHCYPENWDGEGDGFSIRQHVEDLSEFIMKINIGAAHLVGHSRGGAVVLKMVCTYPHLVHSAILADPAPFDQMFEANSEMTEELEQRNNIVKTSLKLINRGEVDKGLEVFTDSVSLSGTWERLTEPAKQIRRDNAWSLKSLIKDSQEQIGSEDVQRIQTPIMLITGENSPGIYGIMHSKIESCLEISQKAIVDDASHGMHSDNPKLFNKIVLEFLNKNSTK